jgi:hypothetical protein
VQYAEWLDRQQGAHTGAPTNGAGDAGTHDTPPPQPDENAGLPFPRAAILAHLAECRAQLAQAHAARAQTSNDELCETLTRAGVRLAELAADFANSPRPDAEQLEAALTDLEGLLDRAVRAHLPREQVAARRAEAEAQLRPYRTRMDRATYEQTRDNLLAKNLRADCGVPRLSLFYL